MIKLFAFSLILFAQHVCSQTWHQFGGHEYYIEYTSVNSYTQAEEGCAARQATVANVKTKKLRDFLLDSFKTLRKEPFSFYIGATRNPTTHKFQWTDGTSVNETYSKWKNGEPNNENEKCVIMGSYSESWDKFWWNDVLCSSSSRYICQRNLPTTTTPTTTNASTAKPTSTTTARKTTSTISQNTESPTTTVTFHDSTINLQSNEQGSNTLLVAVIASVIGCVIIASGLVTFLLYRKRRRTKDVEQEYAEIDETKRNSQPGSTANAAPGNETTNRNKQSGNSNAKAGNASNTTEDQTSSQAYGSVYNVAYGSIVNQNEAAMYATVEDAEIPNDYKYQMAENQQSHQAENIEGQDLYAVVDKKEKEIQPQTDNLQFEPNSVGGQNEVYAVVKKK